MGTKLFSSHKPENPMQIIIKCIWNAPEQLDVLQ